MSGDCVSREISTAQVLLSKPYAASVYPMLSIVWRTTSATLTTACVVISPATTAMPVVTRVSQATREAGSLARMASRTESEIWSATLSGWPSVTDSDVKRNSRAGMATKAIAAAERRFRLLDAQEERDLKLVRVSDRVFDRGTQGLQVPADLVGHAI